MVLKNVPVFNFFSKLKKCLGITIDVRAFEKLFRISKMFPSRSFVIEIPKMSAFFSENVRILKNGICKKCTLFKKK